LLNKEILFSLVVFVVVVIPNQYVLLPYEDKLFKTVPVVAVRYTPYKALLYVWILVKTFQDAVVIHIHALRLL
jgi:hypothetical protein